jgi:LmbE family N-acetylglucosaminyl deacetylase
MPDAFPPTSGRVLIVSPHRDDAALSCAALLARAEALEILTVFGGEPFPPRQGEWDRITGHRDSAEAATIRRAEEAAAFAHSPHSFRELDLLDWQYTGDSWNYDECTRAPTDADTIQRTLSDWLSHAGGGTIALPAGCGIRAGRLRSRLERFVPRLAAPSPHPDHLFVRDTALQILCERADANVILYEELPYSLRRSGAREVAKLEQRWGFVGAPVELEVEREAKAGRIAAYASQIPHLAPARLDQPESLPHIERYWRCLPAQ